MRDVVFVPSELVRREEQRVREGDIVISSANSWSLVGKCCWVPSLSGAYAVGGFVTGLRVTSEHLDSRYLYLWLSSPRIQAALRNTANQTTNIANLNLRRCEELPIPLPPLAEQRRIATILDHADSLRTLNQKTTEHLSDLSQALFVESFGDDLDNQSAPLEDLASVSSGITKGRKTSDSTRPVPYLAVVNVQAGYLALDPIKEIDATDAEIARYALAAGDLVLTEGGDPDKLGRGTLWRNELPLCLHQNHIFRVRVSQDAKLEPEYLSAFMASRTARSYFLRAAKQTTGIASINMTQLRGLPVFVPPIADQKHYLDRVAAVSRQLHTCTVRSFEVEALFTSLQSRAFSGQLLRGKADV